MLEQLVAGAERGHDLHTPTFGAKLLTLKYAPMPLTRVIQI